MSGRMPILCEDDVAKIFGKPVDDRHHLIAAWYGKGAVRTEVVLHVNHNEGVAIVGRVICSQSRLPVLRSVPSPGRRVDHFLAAARVESIASRASETILLRQCTALIRFHSIGPGSILSCCFRTSISASDASLPRLPILAMSTLLGASSHIPMNGRRARFAHAEIRRRSSCRRNVVSIIVV